MSIIPAKNVRLDLYEGSTFDETFVFFEDDEITTMDLDGWGAEMKVRKDKDGPVLLAVTNGALVEGPTAKAIEIDGLLGTARIYVGSTEMAALNEEDFEAVTEEDETVYRGRWDLELIKPVTLERFRYVMGPVEFSPEITY